jgi:hypothetical protein
MADHFYLISNASTDIYRNSLTKFTNHFGQNPLILNAEDKYQIGLQDIFIHPRFPNIPLLPSNVPHIRVYKKSTIFQEAQERNLTTNIYDFMSHIAISLPYQNYTARSLIETINQRVPKEISLSLSPLPSNGVKLNVTVKPISDGDEYFIFFHVKIAVMLGMVKEYMLIRDGYKASIIHLDNHDYYPFHSINNDRFLEIVLKDNIPKIIKVEINNVQPINENESQACILSYHALNMITPHLHYKQFDYPLYLTLSSANISEFTVRLLDENNNQLKLDTSLPTILKMSLRRFDEGVKQFNIVIDSTKKNLNYPDNTGNNFSINLSPPIILDDDYVCSINSISYSTFFKTLPIAPRNSYIRVIRRLQNRTPIVFMTPFNPKKKPFFNIQDVINVLNEDCKVPPDYPDAHLLKHPVLDRCVKFAVEPDEKTGVSYVHVGGFPDTVYDLPQELQSILGERDANTFQSTSTPNTRWMFELDKEKIKDGKSLFHYRKFFHPPDVISLIPQTLFIYSNIIQPIQMGDSQVNLLQIIPVRSDAIDRHKNKYITEAIERPNWTQLKTRTLDVLSFQILRSDGREIGFQDEKDGVIITLTFKKARRVKANNVLFY